MDGAKSKFDFGDFWCDGDMHFACNRARYSKEAACALFEHEVGWPAVSISTGAVSWNAGINEYGEPVVGLWLHLDKDGSAPRQCPVLVLR